MKPIVLVLQFPRLEDLRHRCRNGWVLVTAFIITKAGPGTIAEALIRGLPIILNDYIPGQVYKTKRFILYSSLMGSLGLIRETRRSSNYVSSICFAIRKGNLYRGINKGDNWKRYTCSRRKQRFRRD
ncbi:hypothetical protein HanRHA438_Chr10g0437801 [Helianthus annuus]|nr:hypothetical protein HanRHA438_Chr10g0437801 [Helianthus annuus]KAJ0882521.1 hypothetical protein HanPSC8_Chr10g0410641 [Helianthus annuus]